MVILGYSAESDHAYADYLNGMKYKDIAAKYGVTINTVKSWKSRYQWSRDDKKMCAHKKQKSVHTKNDRKKSEKRYRNRVHGRIVRKCRIDRKNKGFSVYTTCAISMPQRRIKRHMNVAIKLPWSMAAKC